jgi:hypothetical protein
MTYENPDVILMLDVDYFGIIISFDFVNIILHSVRSQSSKVWTTSIGRGSQ